MKSALTLPLLLALGACASAPPVHTLTVRDPAKACAFIRFSRCAAEPAALDWDAEASESDGPTIVE